MSLSDAQRQLVRERAGNCCEYCRVPQSARLVRFQVDHIIAVKHGGTDDSDNLCLACYKCNSYKGSNVAALDPLTNNATKLYHPRRQKWEEHFKINPDATVSGKTPEGRTTLFVLRINDQQRVNQRVGEMAVGDYPCQSSTPEQAP
jgi:hypothetical protein